jgi:predicted transcriptional regulator
MRSTSTLTISLPPAMAKELEKVRKAEHRTRSELVREALRLYFSRRFPVVVPTPAEVRGLRRGRTEIARGDYLTYDELRNALATARRPTGRKKAPASHA